MCQESERGPIQDDWLVDQSQRLAGGKTRVTFFDPQDELHCHDIVFDLEGMTVEEISTRLGEASVASKWTYERVVSLAALARDGSLRSFADL